LVPSIAAGAIIGKGGETIAQVQKESGARVKMSKANDFYPGKIYCKIFYYFEFHTYFSSKLSKNTKEYICQSLLF
jgi:hypothetical protein